jgi:uncharacterized protein YndB with AHSA1/START domain
MRILRVVYILLLCACAPFARAAVSEADAGHFVLHYTIAVKTPVANAYANVVDVARWWSSDHTYSSSAKNLRLDARAGGCWCEKWDGGSVQHMTVLLAMPGKLLRLGGGLGPLQSGAVDGTLTFSFKATEGGSEISVDYAVAGFFTGGLDKVAGGVDQVLGAQIERLRQLSEGLTPSDPIRNDPVKKH